MLQMAVGLGSPAILKTSQSPRCKDVTKEYGFRHKRFGGTPIFFAHYITRVHLQPICYIFEKFLFLLNEAIDSMLCYTGP